jgi:hypothetical protein
MGGARRRMYDVRFAYLVRINEVRVVPDGLVVE